MRNSALRWCAAVLLVSGCTARAGLDLAAFRYIHAAEPTTGREEVAAVPLTSEVWDGAADRAIEYITKKEGTGLFNREE